MIRTLVVGGEDTFSERLAAELATEAVIYRDPVENGAGLRDVLVSSRPRGVVYVAPSRSDRFGLPKVWEAARVAALCREAGIRHTILISSSEAIEPDCRHPGLVFESWRAEQGSEHPIARRWLELEEKFLEAAGSGACVLRPAPLLESGALDAGSGFFTRLFRGRAAFTLPGYNPSLQLLAPEDLSRALERVVEAKGVGIFHVAPAGTIPLHSALRLAGVPRIPVPAVLQSPVRWALKAFGRAEPTHRLAYLRYPFTVDSERLRSLGWRPLRTSAEALLDSLPDLPEKRRPAEGELRFDDLGMDEKYIARRSRGAFRFLHDVYWRIDIEGTENVPTAGRGVLVGVHRGHQPYDGVMLLQHLVRQLGRAPRFLIHPSLTKPPFLSDFMTRVGGILACRVNAERVLRNDELLGVFPEGIRGAFTRYRDAYRLRRFGRNEFVRLAIANRAPIIPFVTVGSAEIFPILGKIRWPWWQRLSLWPCFPITPTLSLLPLPSKWHTVILEPIHVEKEFPPAAAEDPEVVQAVAQQVRRSMEQALGRLLARRRHLFWGRLSDAVAETSASRWSREAQVTAHQEKEQ